MYRKVLILGPSLGQTPSPAASAASCGAAIRALARHGTASVFVGCWPACASLGEEGPDQLYQLPTTAEFLEPVIDRERPDALLWTFGDPGALGTVAELEQRGVLARWEIDVVPRPERVRRTQDPDQLAQLVRTLGLAVPPHRLASSPPEARAAAADLGYPLAVRALTTTRAQSLQLVADRAALDAALDEMLPSSRHLVLRTVTRSARVADCVVTRTSRHGARLLGMVELLEPMMADADASALATPPVSHLAWSIDDLGASACAVIDALDLVGLLTVRIARAAPAATPLVAGVTAWLTPAARLVALRLGRPLEALAIGALTGSLDVAFQEQGPPRGSYAAALPLHSPSGAAHAAYVASVGPTMEEALLRAHALADARLGAASPAGAEQAAAVGTSWERLPAPQRWAALVAALRAGAAPHELSARTGIAAHTLSRLVDVTERRSPQESELRGSTPFAGDQQPMLVLGGARSGRPLSADDHWVLAQTLESLARGGMPSTLWHADLTALATGAGLAARVRSDPWTPNAVAAIVREAGITTAIMVPAALSGGMLKSLQAVGVRVLGSPAKSLDRAHDPQKLAELLGGLGVPHGRCLRVSNADDALGFAELCGYPVLVQQPDDPEPDAPCATPEALRRTCKALKLSADRALVLIGAAVGSRMLEVDGVAAAGRIVLMACSEHVEPLDAGDGLSSLVLPPQRTYPEVLRRARALATQICSALEIHGAFTLKLGVADHDVRVLKLLLRPSRNLPFVSRVLNVNFVDLATRVLVGRGMPPIVNAMQDVDFVGVTLRSTPHEFVASGSADARHTRVLDVTCFGDDAEDATLKAFLAAGFQVPVRTALLSGESVEDRIRLIRAARGLRELNVRLLATEATAECLRTNGVEATVLALGRDAATHDAFARRRVELVVSISSLLDGAGTAEASLRREARQRGIAVLTDVHIAQRFIEALARRPTAHVTVRRWAEYQGRPEVDVYAGRE